MTKYKFLIGVCLSFAAGVGFASMRILPMIWLTVLIGSCVSVFGVSYFVKNNKVAVSACFALAFLFGIYRLQASVKSGEYENLIRENQKQELEAYIVEDVDMRLDKQLVTVEPKGYSQRLLLTLPLSQKYFYGDWVLVKGKITKAKESQDFDYGKYLERYNVYGLMYYPEVIVLKNSKQSFMKERLLQIKYAFAKRLDELYGEPQKSLLLGILIGARKTLPAGVVEDFKMTGTSHIIAVSGFNISIIINSLFGLAYIIGRRASFWVSLLVIVSFVVITGGSASVIRAAIMGSMLLIASMSFRQYMATGAIICAGAFMLLENPKIVAIDVGFQLSFLATLGIVYFLPLFEKITGCIPKLWGIKTMLLGTVSAIVATLPVLLFHFGTLSVVAPITNILVLPVVGVVMALGFASILPIIGAGLAMVASWLLSYIVWITHFFTRLSFASLEVPIPLWFFYVLMACLGGLYFVLGHFARGMPEEVEESPHLW